ncbi:MAG TPA: hypothetical protein VGP72_20025 [Planctomycetota bacterium]
MPTCRDTGQSIAGADPDAVARNLLHSRQYHGQRALRPEVWALLGSLGSSAVLQRAASAILTTRSLEELAAVLKAAVEDKWVELTPLIAARFHKETHALNRRRPGAALRNCFDAFAEACDVLGVSFQSADVKLLLHSRLGHLRAVGARIVLKQQCTELLEDCFALLRQKGEPAIAGAEAVGELGCADHAARIWTRALAVRKSGRQQKLRYLLRVLARMGAFDAELAVKVWIGEDLAAGEDPWIYATIWSELAAAKMAAEVCEKREVLDDLRWFLRVSGTARRANSTSVNVGLFQIARQLVFAGAASEAEELIARSLPQPLPSPEEFPELLFPGLIPLLRAQPMQNAGAWLAALGDADAQRSLVSQWQAAFCAGRTPENWDTRVFMDPAAVTDALRQSLRAAPGHLRKVLALLTPADVLLVQKELRSIALRNASSVVRWKARRLLRSAGERQPATQRQPSRHRWLRLDAAVLSGATRAGQPKEDKAVIKATPTGILRPETAGAGYRLKLDDLTPRQREATLNALCSAPLNQALQRELPSGPSLEERPDIRSVRLPAAPANELDERMAELAAAVMNLWTESNDVLGLDEEGLRKLAAFLAMDGRVLDEEDLMACGAFIGEMLRRRAGGQWTGFDEHYRLEIPVRSPNPLTGDLAAEAGGSAGETLVLDPLGMAAEIYAHKNPAEATGLLLENYRRALETVQAGRMRGQPGDPAAAFQDTILRVGEMAVDTPMTELMKEARSFAFRLNADQWPAVLSALEPLIESAWVRVAAAFAIYAPGESFCRLWAQQSQRRRRRLELVAAIIEAMKAAVERDDLEAMPDWTFRPAQARYNFLGALRRRMPGDSWRGVLQLLLRQRAAVGDRSGASWCLYSYRYEFSDCLPLLQLFCGMSVSARQSLVQASVRSTRHERKLMRPLWAEALRDPAAAVVVAAIEAARSNNVRSLRPLIKSLCRDAREAVSKPAEELLKTWAG